MLIVDDVAEVRELFAQFLGRSGMRVTQADGGWAGLATAREAAPDLIVTDISMPDMDGLELCRRIRTDPTIGEVPILVVSGELPTDDAVTRAAGCDAVLEKPCSRERLVATVRTLLGGRECVAQPQGDSPTRAAGAGERSTQARSAVCP